MTYKSINSPTKDHITKTIRYYADKTNYLNISERVIETYYISLNL